ncbi:hypothetical protein GIB67_007523 [Kingdonia uniflora]|uniref:Uncharacterized protein n=1 Tax=Kingdonia uniflora TaxID=39325 RepID=A0A7J7LW51_9MAGN|nr:hypothetical protein GIB67_007523 [Kingdonia uniflora]
MLSMHWNAIQKVIELDGVRILLHNIRNSFGKIYIEICTAISSMHENAIKQIVELDGLHILLRDCTDKASMENCITMLDWILSNDSRTLKEFLDEERDNKTISRVVVYGNAELVTKLARNINTPYSLFEVSKTEEAPAHTSTTFSLRKTEGNKALRVIVSTRVMPYSTGCKISLSNFEANSNNKLRGQISLAVLEKLGRPATANGMDLMSDSSHQNSSVQLEVVENIITVDAPVQKRISFISRCSCCGSGSIESLNHLLVSGEIAQQVWQFFAIACGVQNISAERFWARQGAQLSTANKGSQMGIIRGVIPAIIGWKLWKAQYQHQFDDVRMNAHTIVHRICKWL